MAANEPSPRAITQEQGLCCK